MAEDTGQVTSAFFKGVVTAIGTGIGAAIVAWMLGWWPAIWGVVTAAASWLWDIVTYSVPIPVVLLIVLAVPVMARIWRWFKQPGPTQAGEAAMVEPELTLSDLEVRVLQLLAHADGLLVQFDDAAARLQTSRLLLGKACESLESAGLLRPDNQSIHGTRLSLTRGGRDYVIARGFPLGGLDERGW